MHAHLTCAVVSNDPIFTNHVLANTVNGTTYAGLRARCTGGLVSDNRDTFQMAVLDRDLPASLYTLQHGNQPEQGDRC